jgi:ATP-dependent Clp protease ATP-binding subunit ClpC
MYNFSPRANDLLATTQLYASKYNHGQINTLHLLIAGISTDDSLLNELLILQGVDVKRFLDRLHHQLDNQVIRAKPSDDMAKIPLDTEVERVLSLAKSISKKMTHSFVGTEHLILGIVCHTECSAFTFMYDNNVDLPGLAQALREYLNPGQSIEEDIQNTGSGVDERSLEPGEALQMFAINMTEQAKQKELDPVIGRNEEITRVMQILCRRQKNNPVLVGEPGVGKTAVVEGLCNMIAENKVPLQLKGKQIYNLDLSLMVAGTKFRGQFEERMKQVMDDLLNLKDAVVFIDEIHMLVGAGNADGAMDAANILKPALGRGGLSCIGTTTFDEYREFIEADGALERRFQKITVEEPDGHTTVEILNGLKHKYEEFHNVLYTETAVELAVNLSGRYITDRCYPDKAIDILDECASRERLKNGGVSPRIAKLDERIKDSVELTKEHLLKDDYISAATYRSAEKKLRKQREQAMIRAKTNQKPININDNHIRQTVSSWCGVPLEHLKKSETRKLVNLEKNINKHVLGQSGAIQVICDSIIRSRTDVGDPGRPVGTFLLMGPTGTGKTYLAKQLAKFVYGDESNMVRVDMSELMESHSVSKLVGSPPGYVGYGEGGQLTEQVRQNPYTVVLFDEIEKAHPDVMQLLLQLLDEGELTDSRGVSVNFRNCLVLMTSNIGADRMQKSHVVGFGSTDEQNMDDIKKQLQSHLRPEFINRLDEIVMFNSLNMETCKKILEHELKKFITRMEMQQVQLKITGGVKTMLLEQGFDKKFGARPLRRIIQSKVQTPVAKFLLEHERPVDIDATVHENSVVIGHKKSTGR